MNPEKIGTASEVAVLLSSEFSCNTVRETAAHTDTGALSSFWICHQLLFLYNDPKGLWQAGVSETWILVILFLVQLSP